MDIAQNKADERLQHNIAKAVNRPHTKGRDFCVDCTIAIPEPRRKANPHAIRCVDCQEEFEAGTPYLKLGA